MTTNCPKCGKPLRPGVRFCGNCGYSLPAKPPQQANAPGAAPPAQPGGTLCPHCQSPVRPGAKFCNSCGTPIAQEIPAAGVPNANQVASSPPTVVTPPRQPIQQPLPARSATPAEAAAPPRRAGTWTWAIIGFLVIGCILAIAAGFLYLRDPFGWFGKATATPLPSPTAAQVAPPIATDTPAIQITETMAPTDTAAPDGTALPTDTSPPPSPLPTFTLTSTMAITPTATLTASFSVTPSLQAGTLLDEDFSGRLETNWIAWGSPHPLISSGATGNWLDLKAETPNAAGVTTKQQITNAPGVEIEFSAQLNPTFLRYVLTFEWDPLPYRRDRSNPEDRTMPGAVHLELHRNMLIIAASQASNGCKIEDVLGEASHIYKLRFIEGQGIDLYLDNQVLPICQIANMRVDPTPGNISFTGLGWLTHVRVTSNNGP